MKNLLFILFALISAASFGQKIDNNPSPVYAKSTTVKNTPVGMTGVYKFWWIKTSIPGVYYQESEEPGSYIKLDYRVPATREMTDAEKISLATYAPFIDYCKQSVRNFAAFRADPSSFSTLSTEAAAIKWAKDKLISVGFANNPVIGDSDIGTRFIFYSKGATFDLPSAPAGDAAIFAVWVSGNRFEEFVSKYFDYLGEGYNMSLTGN